MPSPEHIDKTAGKQFVKTLPVLRRKTLIAVALLIPLVFGIDIYRFMCNVEITADNDRLVQIGQILSERFFPYKAVIPTLWFAKCV